MAMLKVVKGGNAGHCHELGGPQTVVGRHPQCDFVLPAHKVSRRHARILHEADGFYLQDLGSRNGTFLNGQKLHGRERLEDQDCIGLCDVLLVFQEGNSHHEALPGDIPAEQTEEEAALARPSTALTSLDALADLRVHVNPAAKLRAVLQITQNLGSSLDIDEVLPKILDSVFSIFPQSDRGYILLAEEEGARLEPFAVKHRYGEPAEAETMGPISHTITSRVMAEARAILSTDASSDARFERSQSVFDLEIRCMMCAPLIGPSRQPLGILYVDSHDIGREFTKDDLDVLVSVATLAGQAVEYARMHKTLLDERRQAEETLRASEVRFRSVWENSADAMRLTDQEGLIVAVNPAYCELVGIPSDQLVGRPLTVAYADDEDSQGLLRKYQRRFREEAVEKRLERSLTFRSGRRAILVITDSLIEIEAGDRLLLSIFHDITERKRLEKEVADLAVYEQQRIGQELHDGLGQELTGLGYLARSLLQRLQNQRSGEVETATQLAKGLQGALGQVRTIAKGLVPVEVDAEGLMFALRDLAANTQDLFGIACRFECNRPIRVMDNNVAFHLYRIAQEAITNALKHGDAKNVEIELRADAERITLTVRDDGVGIQPAAGPPDGVGLRIMRYRAGILGASFDVRPAPDRGTLVICVLNQSHAGSGPSRS